MATQTFILEGKQYTVPKGTSMDELDTYIKGQSLEKSASQTTNKQADPLFKSHPSNLLYKNIQERESPEKIAARQKASKAVASGLETFGTAASLVGTGAGVATNPIGVLKTVGGSLAGGYLGQEGMKLLHAPEWLQAAGGIAGGLAGGILGPKIVAPDTIKLPFGFKIPLKNAGITSTLAVPGPNLEPPPTVIPEPRPTLPTDKPGLAYSLSRPDDLVDAAKSSQPGAGEALQNTRPGKVLYEPREGTGYKRPKAVIRFPQ